ncbi:cell division protein ZapA [Rheinheimera soli]|uniref:Cell division protein ZapA (FtsZ GTPase activity inhibitor) n=1 Tax=Rheinheimera soli TaxID=443616 RepID=A0ABU1W1I0_9GAMM|nr:cell division protein ZapA [Rheinheimera soli]MDR7121819.1 cell division protein ZapA (FtsZ GTPase activity inhibitor) [Rheinheimera soli]
MLKQPLVVEQKVVIAGREYWLRCLVKEQAELQEAARLLNTKIAQVRQGAGHLSMEQSIVLAALSLGQQLVTQQNPAVDETKQRLAKLTALIEANS